MFVKSAVNKIGSFTASHWLRLSKLVCILVHKNSKENLLEHQDFVLMKSFKIGGGDLKKSPPPILSLRFFDS